MSRHSPAFAAVLSILFAAPVFGAKPAVPKPPNLKTEYQSRCDAGDPKGCVALARVYQYGLGIERERDQAALLLKRAVGLYQSACDANDASACSTLAYLVGAAPRGYGSLKDFRELIDRDIPTEKDLYSRAAALYGKACDAGDASACAKEGDVYRSQIGGWCEQAVVRWDKACEGDSADGCLLAGIARQHGWGVTEDQARARKDLLRSDQLYRNACEGGSAAACAVLGDSYESGYRSVEKDESTAVSLWEKACNGGLAEACKKAIRRLKNLGGRENATRIASLISPYERACRAGVADGDSCDLLAGYVQNGLKVEVDFDLEWNDPKRRTLAVKPDTARGLSLYERTCAEGEDDSCRHLEYQRNEQAKSAAAAAAATAAAKKRADDIAACEAACLRKKKPEAVCKRICAQ